MLIGATLFDKQELHDDIVAKINQWFNRQIGDEKVLVFKFGGNGECALNVDEMLTFFLTVSIDDGTTLIQFNTHQSRTKIRIIIRP